MRNFHSSESSRREYVTSVISTLGTDKDPLSGLLVRTVRAMEEKNPQAEVPRISRYIEAIRNIAYIGVLANVPEQVSLKRVPAAMQLLVNIYIMNRPTIGELSTLSYPETIAELDNEDSMTLKLSESEIILLLSETLQGIEQLQHVRQTVWN